MAVIVRTLAQSTPPPARMRRRRRVWDRFVDAIAGFGRMLQVIAAIERIPPGQQVAVPRTWLRTLP
jgi:hypothetical protein